MAMLLVLMLIVLVSAAGVFAAQSTALEVRSAGFTRQAGQTHYVAESGVVTSMAELKEYCSAYLGLMRQQSASQPTPPGMAAPPMQWAFQLGYFNQRAAASGGIFAERVFADPATGAGGRRVEGSLGTSLLEPAFATTALVLGESLQPLPGFSVGGGRDFRVPVLAVEFSSEGMTRLRGVADVRENAVGREMARVIAQVPCL